jgi:hypothetical protein
MNKDEIYEVLAKAQGCSVQTLKDPAGWDTLSKVFNDIVEEADDLDNINSDLQYAIHVLTKAYEGFNRYHIAKQEEEEV